MKDLVSYSEYEKTAPIRWHRIGYVAGVSFGVLLAAWFSLSRDAKPDHSGTGLATVLAVFLIAATTFGVLFTLGLRLAMRRQMRMAFQGTGPFAVSPPEGNWEYRLACSLKKTPRLAIGGSLLVGDAEAVFVPHARNLRSCRTLQWLGPLNRIRFTVEPQEPHWLATLLFAELPPLLTASTPSGVFKFLAPLPEVALQRLARLCAQLGNCTEQHPGGA